MAANEYNFYCCARFSRAEVAELDFMIILFQDANDEYECVYFVHVM